MTMPQAAQIVAGPSLFVTLDTVIASPNPTAGTIVFTGNTDQAVQLQVTVWDVMNPGTTISAQDTGAVQGAHSITVSGLGSMLGKNLGFRITSLTTPPPTLRPYYGSVRMPGVFTRANPAVPVRFYQFGGTPPPAAGGTPIPPQPGPANLGNWNTYAWAQYNPKGTTYPTP